VLTKLLSGKKFGVVAITLAVVMCLSIIDGALAASVPSAPANFTAVAGDGQVTLVWFAPESDGGSAVTKYQISLDGGASWVNVDLSTTYTILGLDNGTTYIFAVRAVNSEGTGEVAVATATPKGSGVGSDPGGNNQGQGQGPWGGQGSSDPQDPPLTPPESPPNNDETPQREDNIPVEVEPDIDGKPVKLKKAKIKKMVYVWTITAKGESPKLDEAGTLHILYLEFTATKQGGETLFGNYTVTGTYRDEIDEDAYKAKAPHMVKMEVEWGGPVTSQFTLSKPQDDMPKPTTNDDLAPLVPTKTSTNDELAPLVPTSSAPAPLTRAKANASMRWDSTLTKDSELQDDGRVFHADPGGPLDVKYEVIVYEDGSAVVRITTLGTVHSFKGRLTKVVKLMDEN